MNESNKPADDVDLQLQLEQERHERRLDWVAVGILLTLVVLSIWILWQTMAADESAKTADAASWAKTFLTTLGGVAIGVLTKARFRRTEKRDARTKQ